MALGMVLSVILRFLNMSFEWLPISVNLELTLLTWARPWRTYEIVTAKQGKTKRHKSFVGIVAYLISSIKPTCTNLRLPPNSLYDEIKLG